MCTFRKETQSVKPNRSNKKYELPQIRQTVDVQFDESLQREYIRTNRMGAYCCSSIVDCNTRKYHGALVVLLPSLSKNNHVLLSLLDVSIIQHDVPFNIGDTNIEEMYSP